jgi:HK97 gp10 family phage protein
VDTFSIKTEGFKELEQVLVQMGEEMGYDTPARRVLVPAAKEAMQPVLMKALQLIPFDESNTEGPHMRDTLRVSAKQPSQKDRRSVYIDKNDAVIAMVSVKTDKRGISQEFGNARVKMQSFLRPALETQANKVVQILGTYLAYKLQKYKSRKA